MQCTRYLEGNWKLLDELSEGSTELTAALFFCFLSEFCTAVSSVLSYLGASRGLNSKFRGNGCYEVVLQSTMQT